MTEFASTADTDLKFKPDAMNGHWDASNSRDVGRTFRLAMSEFDSFFHTPIRIMTPENILLPPSQFPSPSRDAIRWRKDVNRLNRIGRTSNWTDRDKVIARDDALTVLRSHSSASRQLERCR